MTTAFFQPPALWPFQVGQAVAYVPHLTAFKARPILFPAVVTRPQGDRVGIWREDGARRTVQACSLVYRGYCAACRLPAVERSGLRCPQCEAPAIVDLPPDELVLRWYPLDESVHARSTRYALTTGCTWGEAIKWRRDHDYAVSSAMLERLGLRRIYTGNNEQTMREECRLFKLMGLYAALGDEPAFRATYDDLLRLKGLPPVERHARPLYVDWDDTYLRAQMERSRSEETPLSVVRPDDDAEPDTNTGTALDAWLDAQFR